jgi:hypothetical protein
MSRLDLVRDALDGLSVGDALPAYPVDVDDIETRGLAPRGL